MQVPPHAGQEVLDRAEGELHLSRAVLHQRAYTRAAPQELFEERVLGELSPQAEQSRASPSSWWIASSLLPQRGHASLTFRLGGERPSSRPHPEQQSASDAFIVKQATQRTVATAFAQNRQCRARASTGAPQA